MNLRKRGEGLRHACMFLLSTLQYRCAPMRPKFLSKSLIRVRILPNSINGENLTPEVYITCKYLKAGRWRLGQVHRYSSSLFHLSIVPSGWWEVYKPEPHRPSEPSDAAKMLRIVLLAPEREFAANVTMADLTRFITDIEVWIQKVCVRAETSFELLVKCTLNPSAQPIIQIATKSENAQDLEHPPLIKDLYEALGTIEPLNTSRSSVTFHLHFAVSRVADRS